VCRLRDRGNVFRWRVHLRGERVSDRVLHEQWRVRDSKRRHLRKRRRPLRGMRCRPAMRRPRGLCLQWHVVPARVLRRHGYLRFIRR
jgi:hypothetical protein